MIKTFSDLKSELKTHPPIKTHTFKDIKEAHPDTSYYIKSSYKKAKDYIYNTLTATSTLVSTRFSYNYLNTLQIKNTVFPAIASVAAWFAGDYLTTRMSQTLYETNDYDVLFKLLMGGALLAYSATYRITDHQIESTPAFAIAAACDAMSIGFLYTASFKASRLALENCLSNKYSLIASIGTSLIAVPCIAAHLSKKYQDRSIKKLYAKGAQRSDTASISSGFTPISNKYFLINYYISGTIKHISRLFQLGLISYDILTYNTIPEQYKNFLGLFADMFQPVATNVLDELKKIDTDFKHNTSIQKVLRFIDNKPSFTSIEQHKLRHGDLVCCDEKFNFNESPVGGEVITLQMDENNQFTQILTQSKFRINLKSKNGEDVSIEHKTSLNIDSKSKQIDLHAVRAGKQHGVLSGTKLTLFQPKNTLIKIMDEKERTIINDYSKKSVINDIIDEDTSRKVRYSMISSLLFSLIVYQSLKDLPSNTLRVMFSLFQMMIPFSLNFVKENVNRTLMADINKNLGGNGIKTIDALRMVDLCNALGGYYNERFPKNVAIISDKTGTLTTTQMNVRGFWTSTMPDDVEHLQQNPLEYILPTIEIQTECTEVFLSAFTNNTKESEPEEFAILTFLRNISDQKNDLISDNIGNNHLRKFITLNEKKKSIETIHLGLYTNLGGRFSLVSDADKKYLVFCGIPRGEKLKDSSVLKSYLKMKLRTGVLSRDWCIARTQISTLHFDIIKAHFNAEKNDEIEKYILAQQDIINNLVHYCTFIIDNPIKKSADKFISNCLQINIPVFIATGDTAKAAVNVAKVLCPRESKNITIFNSRDFDQKRLSDISQPSAIIFSGLNDAILSTFDQLIKLDTRDRPIIIFSEMSPKEKGMLAVHLKKLGFFVVMNGDQTNDIPAMKEANAVFSHLPDDETPVSGVELFSNLNDKQLSQMMSSDKSFYELFDIHRPTSQFIKFFSPLANSQEKPSIALTLKSTKISFKLMKELGAPHIIEMPNQHYWSIPFDLTWFYITYRSIISTQDTPMDNKNLIESSLANECMIYTILMSTLQSVMTYAISGETTNGSGMLLVLCFLPVILNSIYSRFRHARETTSYGMTIDEIKDEKPVKVINHQPLRLLSPHNLRQVDADIIQQNQTALSPRTCSMSLR